VRDRLRLALTIGLVYGTTSQQLRAILAELEAILRRQPKICQDTVGVRLGALGASSLDVEVGALLETTDWAEFQAVRQELLLAFMAAIEQHGSAIAFPTRTIHVATAIGGSPLRPSG
jgi:MscS family membrane protein